jgi:hypothetical protein
MMSQKHMLIFIGIVEMQILFIYIYDISKNFMFSNIQNDQKIHFHENQNQSILET